MNKPIVKWVGGKTQILNTVLSTFPLVINNYYEPFVGGSSVLIGVLLLLKKRKIEIKGSIYANDINVALIGLYKNIQHRVDFFMVEINILVTQYNSLEGDIVDRKAKTMEAAMTSKESYYYYTRNRYNIIPQKDSIIASALFLFINKTCFRGMHREGPNGFNVPFGNYKRLNIDEKHIRAFSLLVKDVIFTSTNYAEALTNISGGDFIYLDPPYAPINNKSFVSYNLSGFDAKEHKNLFQYCNTLEEKKIKFVMSNAETELVKTSFDKYNKQIISCRRAINSKKPESKVNELLIDNFTPISALPNQ